jgi:hypothetical protein
MVRSVNGTATPQYTHICLEAFQPSSPKEKKVVLKSACDCISKMKEKGQSSAHRNKSSW